MLLLHFPSRATLDTYTLCLATHTCQDAAERIETKVHAFRKAISELQPRVEQARSKATKLQSVRSGCWVQWWA